MGFPAGAVAVVAPTSGAFKSHQLPGYTPGGIPAQPSYQWRDGVCERGRDRSPMHDRQQPKEMPAAWTQGVAPRADGWVPSKKHRAPPRRADDEVARANEWRDLTREDYEKLKKENEELKRLLGEITWAREKEREEKEKMITEAANTLFSPEAAPLFNGGQSSSMEVSATASSATEEQAEGELQRFRDEYDMNPEWA